jgi:hypothetical protein
MIAYERGWKETQPRKKRKEKKRIEKKRKRKGVDSFVQR